MTTNSRIRWRKQPTSAEHPNAATRVFAVQELREQIFLNLQPQQILKHLPNDLMLYHTVKESPTLQQKLLLRPIPTAPNPTSAWPQDQPGPPNHLLFRPNCRSTIFRTREGGPQFHLYLSPDFDSEWWQYTLYMERETTSRPFTSRILPPVYLHTLLSTHDRPVHVSANLRWGRDPGDYERDQARFNRGSGLVATSKEMYWPRDLFVEAGSTLGDVLMWMETFATGKLRNSDVVNGIRQFNRSLVVNGVENQRQAEREKEWREEGFWVLRKDGVWLKPIGK